MHEAHALMALAKQYAEVPLFMLGNRNLFVPRHEVTRAVAKAIRANILATGDEGSLHKDWALVPYSLVDEQHVADAPGVTDHL